MRHVEASGFDNMQQLIQLRWIAVVGQIATIMGVHFGFRISLPLQQMSIALVLLIAFNLGSSLRWRISRPVTNGELFVALLVDVGTLTAQLYWSGGAANPFCFLYLLQVILGAVLLSYWSVWSIVLLTLACFTGLTVFHRPLLLPANHAGLLFEPYVEGTLLCFTLNAALLVVFITRISRNVRARDARLAAMRERAAEEEQIVRMGLLASGAAHELGTPLSTVSVILGDWRRMPLFAGDGELLQEIDEMQTQLQRCKSIVDAVLLSAGEARGESPGETTIRTFLDSLVEEWLTSRSVEEFTYFNEFGEDLPIVADSSIKQMIHNVLDNGLEASPAWVGFEVNRDAGTLRLCITDSGPGFAAAMLTQLGKPYQSTKGRPGAGLGLFLVSNVARNLGGSVSARNRPEGGAEVTVLLPLSTIALGPESTHGS